VIGDAPLNLRIQEIEASVAASPSCFSASRRVGFSTGRV